VSLAYHFSKESRMIRKPQRTRRIGLVAGVAALSVVVTGCTAGGTSPEESTVLNLWYGFEPGQADAVTTLIQQWDEANDNVTVEITAMGPELNPPALLPALSAGEGPDMWVGATGPGQPQAFIEAGLVADLGPFYCDLEWNATLPNDLASLVSSDGSLWAIPNSIESTGMFYRKSIFADLGLEVPTTWNDLLSTVATLQENGYATPIGAAGGDGWPVTQLLGAMWGNAAGSAGIENTLFGDGSWDSSEYVEASEKFVELQSLGAFGPEPLAFSYQATMAEFYTGAVPMTYTGGFVIPGAQEDAGDAFSDIGVFALPNPIGGDIVANESPGEGWYVNASSSKIEESVDLINFLFFTEENRTAILEGGLIPAGPLNLDSVELPSVLEELLTAMGSYRDNGVVPAFLEGVTPGEQFEVTLSSVQAVLGNSLNAEELNAAIQGSWQTAKDEGNTFTAGSPPSC